MGKTMWSLLFGCMFLAGQVAQGQNVQVLLSDGSILTAEGERVQGEVSGPALAVVQNGTQQLIVSSFGEVTGQNGEAPFAGLDLPFPLFRDFVLLPGGTGGYLLDQFGGVHALGDAPYFGSQFYGTPFAPLAIGQSLELAIDSSGNAAGYYAVNQYGEIDSFGSVPVLPHVERRDVVTMNISPTGAGYAILTEGGEVLAFGEVPGLDGELNLAPGVETVDFAFTPSGNGYYVLDSSGSVHSFGDALTLDFTPAELEDDVFPVGLVSNVRGGNIENLPSEISPLPTNTPVPTATSTAVPTASMTPTPEAVPTATPAPTGTPVPENTPTPQPVDPTATPEATQVPGETPTQTPTVAVTPTPTLPANTPTPMPTATPAIEPTATPAGPEIVPPGIDSRMLGTFDGTAIRNSTGEELPIRLRIFVENDQVFVEDLSSPALFTTSPLPMVVMDTQSIQYTATGLNLESLAMTLLAPSGDVAVGITGGYTIAGGGFPPIPENYGITIDF